MSKERLTWIWPENNGTVFAGHESRSTVYRRNGTDDWQLLVTTSGRGRIGSVKGDVIVAPGDMVLMRPGVIQDYGMLDPDWEYTWVHFQPRQEWLDLLIWPEHAPGLMLLSRDGSEVSKQIETALERTLERYRGAYHRRQLFALNSLEELLLLCDLLNPLTRARNLDPRIVKITAYLNERLAEKTTLADVADFVGISVSHLSHLFYQHVGMGPIKYLDIQRLEHARTLLETTDLPINVIADRVGFDLRYFSLHFKRYTTLSPRAYRARAAAFVA